MTAVVPAVIAGGAKRTNSGVGEAAPKVTEVLKTVPLEESIICGEVDSAKIPSGRLAW